jgi:protein-L-isoaspartate O-methyltransferase
MHDDEAIVYGMDHFRGILRFARHNIARNHRDFLDSGKIMLVEADGRNGLADYAPFDVKNGYLYIVFLQLV